MLIANWIYVASVGDKALLNRSKAIIAPDQILSAAILSGQRATHDDAFSLMMRNIRTSESD
jgi:hypothetical protein